MSNAGYGNHDAPRPGSAQGERPNQEAAGSKPAAGSTDRPGLDLGGAGDLSSASGQFGGGRSSPDPSGQGPRSGLSDTSSPTLAPTAGGDIATPGQGAGPTGGQGDEADPGVG